MYKKNVCIRKSVGFGGSIYKDCLFLAVVMVVFVDAMIKSNSERVSKQDIYIPTKENSIPSCRTGPLARVHLENFHLTYNPSHNILELYNVLVQIRFSTSKTKLDI